MAGISRRSGKGLARQVRRKRVWARTIYDPGALALDAVDLLANFRGATQFGAQPIGSTVARVRVSGSMAAAAGAMLHVGLLVHTRNVAAVTEVPNPQLDLHEDWMFHHCEAGAGPSGLTGSVKSISWDVKSMRKIEEAADTLWFSYAAGGAATVDWNLCFSVLLLLP